MTGLPFNSIWKYPEKGVFAKVDSFAVRDDKNWVLFDLWDPARPGWQGGAALTRDQFTKMYSEGPITEGAVVAAMPLMKIRITATLEYTVDPRTATKAYGTSDPALILEIDRENAWQIIYDEMTAGDNVRINVEEVSYGGDEGSGDLPL